MGIFTFTVMVAMWSAAIGLLGSPVAYWFGVFRLEPDNSDHRRALAVLAFLKA